MHPACLLLCRCANELEKASSAVSQAQADGTATLTRLAESLPLGLSTGLSSGSSSDSSGPSVDAVLSSLLTAAGHASPPAVVPVFAAFLKNCSSTESAVDECSDWLQQAAQSVAATRSQLDRLAVMTNEYSAVVQQLQGQLARQQDELQQRKQEQQELAHKVLYGLQCTRSFGPGLQDSNSTVRAVHVEFVGWLESMQSCS